MKYKPALFLTTVALLLIGLLPGSGAYAQPPVQSVGPGGIIFPVAGTVTLRWLYSCGDDPTSLRSRYGYRLNGTQHTYGTLSPDAFYSCYERVHTLTVDAGDVLKVWLESYDGFPEGCHYGRRHFAPPANEQSQWVPGSADLVGTVYWEDMLIGCLGGDFDFDDVVTRIWFTPDPVDPPTLSIGPSCSRNADRTVSWTENPALEYRVQAARNAAFTADVRNSGWISGGSHTFTGLDEGTYYYRIRARYAGTSGPWGATQNAQQDYTPPATSATPSGVVGLAGWWVSPVTIDLFTVESGCGLQDIVYRMDGGAWQAYSDPWIISDEGVHSIEYYSTDVPGNVEALQSLVVKIDTADPMTGHLLSGTTGNAGWWRSEVTVNVGAYDVTSGVRTTEYRVDGGSWQTYSAPFVISGEGSHSLAYRSHDVAGNDEAVRTVSVDIDTVAPDSNITRPAAGDWISGTITLSGTALDPTPGSGVDSVVTSRDGGNTWQAAGGTGTWSTNWDTTAGPDGDYDLSSRADDVAGNRESPGFMMVHVDNTPPDTAVALNGTAGDSGWTLSSVDVTLAADDGSGIGVRRTLYRIDGGMWRTYSGPFTVSGDGSHTVEYRSVDRLGNREAVGSRLVRIDTLAPDTTALPDGIIGKDGWWISDVDVALTGVDATSGVALTEYRVDGGSWQTYGGPFPVSGEGSHTVDYHSRDVAGNWESDDSLTIRIDTVDPRTSSHLYGVSGNAGWWRSVVSVVLDGADATSGVDEIEIDVDGGSWATYAAPVLVSGQGDHTADYRSTDVAGNVEAAGSVSFRIDSIAPRTMAAITGTLGDNGWYTTPVAVAFGAADSSPGSGVDEVFLDDQAVTGPVQYEDGVHDLTYHATDVAGNVAPERVLDLKVDTVPPTAGLTGGTFCPGCGEVIVLQLEASDATSGVASWRLQIMDRARLIKEWSGDGRPTSRTWSGRGLDAGSYDLILHVRDHAGWGNTATGTVRVRRPDSPPPPPPPTSTPVPPPQTPTSVPTPAATPRPGETPTATSPPSPTSTPRPGATPTTTPPSPTPTPTPMVISEVEATVDRGLALVVGIFEDPDTDAVKGKQEPGLAEWVVRVEGSGGWRHDFTADARGLVTVTLPVPATYTFTVVDAPGNWEPTSRSEITIRLGQEGDVVILPTGTGKGLPVGVAERTTFAFGLVPRRMAVFVPLAGIGLLLVVAATGVLDPRPKALREFQRILVD